MAHECGGNHDSIESVRADQTVGEVAHRRAGALETLKAFGINHCCGAQLTLTEAAASAGVPLAALLGALNAPDTTASPTGAGAARNGRRVRLVLDVRGLEPPHPMLKVLQQLDRLDAGAELEVRHDRRPMLLYPQLEQRGFTHETDQPHPGLVRIVIRRREH